MASVATGRRRGGGEDPWLCGPGFPRVCLCRGMVRLSYVPVQELSSDQCRRDVRRVTEAMPPRYQADMPQAILPPQRGIEPGCADRWPRMASHPPTFRVRDQVVAGPPPRNTKSWSESTRFRRFTASAGIPRYFATSTARRAAAVHIRAGDAEPARAPALEVGRFLACIGTVPASAPRCGTEEHTEESSFLRPRHPGTGKHHAQG